MCSDYFCVLIKIENAVLLVRILLIENAELVKS